MLEHQRLRAAHNHLSLYDKRPSEIFLEYCTQESRLSLYPKNFTIVSFIFPLGAWSAKNQDDQAARNQIRQMAIEKGELFLSQRIVSFLDELDGEEFGGAMTALIARCLPKLENISFMDEISRIPSRDFSVLSQRSSRGTFLTGLIKGITELSIYSIKSRVFPCLSRFSIIRTFGDPVGIDLEPFLPILALPNLRSFEATRSSCSSFNSLPFPPHTSKVETLKIFLVSYSVNSISTLFSAFDALRVLEFAVVLNQSMSWRCYSVVYESLSEHCRDSLQHFGIRNVGGQRMFFDSLRPFSILRSVIIDSLLLYRDGDVMSRLMDLFPGSIQEIICSGFMLERQEREFFNGFLREREGKVPDLRCVIRCGGSDFDRYPKDLQEGRDYCFTYLTYYGEESILQVIDAAGQWKLVKPSREFLKERGISPLPNGYL